MTIKSDIEKKETLHNKNQAQSKIKKIEEKLKQVQLELDQKNDKLLRTCADVENFRKRTEKELLFREEETKKKYISELIELHELLKKAIDDENSKQGLILIMQNIEKFFEREEIKHIDCVGKSFDHNLHHAVTTVEREECEDNIVVEEVKKGYLIGDKILRPSQVIVVKNNKENEKVVEKNE